MSRIVVLSGSPNRLAGYSGTLLKSMILGAEAAGATCETYFLYDYNILPCHGCYRCSRFGSCPLKEKDDQRLLEEALISADGLILATPNYMNGVTAQMKLFFDRSFSRLYHCQMLRNKPAAAVISSGGPAFNSVELYLDNVLIDMYCLRMVGTVGAPEGAIDDAEMRQELLESSAALGTRLVKAIENGTPFPEQAERHEQTFEILKYLVVTHGHFAFEKKFWMTHWDLEANEAKAAAE